MIRNGIGFIEFGRRGDGLGFGGAFRKGQNYKAVRFADLRLGARNPACKRREVMRPEQGEPALLRIQEIV